MLPNRCDCVVLRLASLVGHLREKDTLYNPYKHTLYVLAYKGDSFLFSLTGSAKGVCL